MSRRLDNPTGQPGRHDFDMRAAVASSIHEIVAVYAPSRCTVGGGVLGAGRVVGVGGGGGGGVAVPAVVGLADGGRSVVDDVGRDVVTPTVVVGPVRPEDVLVVDATAASAGSSVSPHAADPSRSDPTTSVLARRCTRRA
ncbi:MAG TPA: hypothetical protein VFZ83_05850 [Acidimicrobiia bacterium]|nr:hypothetical protein [Acidimicrobiia bacterium]